MVATKNNCIQFIPWPGCGAYNICVGQDVGQQSAYHASTSVHFLSCFVICALLVAASSSELLGNSSFHVGVYQALSSVVLTSLLDGYMSDFFFFFFFLGYRIVVHSYQA